MGKLLDVCMIIILIIAAPAFSKEKNISQFIDYLPLHAGNSWTYTRVEEPGRIVRNWAEQTILSDGLVYTVRGRMASMQGSTIEIYTVGESVELDQIRFWNIKIGNRARDGRYHHIPEPPRYILWGKRSLREGNLLNIVEERILRYSTMTSIPSEAEHRAEFLIAPEREGVKVSIQRGIAKIICLPKREAINVPAGKFANCLVMVTRIESEEKPSNDDLRNSWEAYSYYAPNVGLVKEVQKDSDGNVTYALELKDYKIVAPPDTQGEPHLISTISPIPANSLSAMEADKAAKSMVEDWRPGAALVDLLADRGAYPISSGTPLPNGRVASEKTIILGEFTEPEELGYSVSAEEVRDKNRFVNIFRWRCIYKYQDEYLTVLVSKHFVQSEEGNRVPDVGTVPIKDWKVDTDQAISIAEQNEAIPRGYYFRLKTWKYNGKLIPFWTIPYELLPDHKIFVINAVTGRFLPGIEAENIESP